VIQFFGALVCNGLFYTLLSYKNLLSNFMYASSLFFSLSLLFSKCILSDIGSRSLIISSQIIRSSNSRINVFHRKEFQKFSKSCPLILLKVGSFHYIDRQRVPHLLRFVLQRTFFLVVRTNVRHKL